MGCSDIVREALGAYAAPRFADASDDTAPGQNTVLAFTSATLVAYMPPFKVLGGNWGVEVLVPLVHARVTTAAGSASATGIGDVTFSALVWQAPPLLLLAAVYSEFAVENRPRGTRASAVVMEVW